MTPHPAHRIGLDCDHDTPAGVEFAPKAAPNLIAEYAIRDRAYEARRLVIERHFALIRDLLVQRNEIRNLQTVALLTGTPREFRSLLNREADLDARIIVLQGRGP